jgi:cysteine-rich repeat protein
MTAAAAAALALPVVAGCAKDPTVVMTEVRVGDENVPVFGVMRTSVARVSNPEQRAWSEAVSLFTVGTGDAAMPAPFALPRVLPVTMDESFAGQVIITVEGLAWNPERTVLASGSTTADAVAGQRTYATIVLTAGPLTCGNGTPDPGETCDDGNHAPGDGCGPGCALETGDGGVDGGTGEVDAGGSDATPDPDAGTD